MGLSCPGPSSTCLPWYASPTESDGPCTSDLSPASGYFDWNHSSNNTSPIHYEEAVPQSRPGGAPHPSSIQLPHKQSPLIANNPNFRRSSYQGIPSTLSCQSHQSLPANYPAERLAIPGEHDASGILLSPQSPLPKDEEPSEMIANDVPEHEDPANSRSGKRWKAAHRAVERRYRSNLNLKIIKLGQCIPAIRNQVIAIEDVENAEDCGTTPKTKLQKGHVLSKAVDYIQSLQQNVSELEAQKRQLESRVEALSMTGRSRPENGSTTGLRNGAFLSDSTPLEGQPQMPPAQNGFSFVSENTSFAMKRPRIPRNGIGRIPSG
jgi:Helix-loop-helix DNA-binding domain